MLGALGPEVTQAMGELKDDILADACDIIQEKLGLRGADRKKLEHMLVVSVVFKFNEETVCKK
jgi:hypothetical protein